MSKRKKGVRKFKLVGKSRVRRIHRKRRTGGVK
jgi:hypothetical protein